MNLLKVDANVAVKILFDSNIHSADNAIPANVVKLETPTGTW
jgi:hypothetical protein